VLGDPEFRLKSGQSSNLDEILGISELAEALNIPVKNLDSAFL